ncbi:hypothetical protein C1645_770970 [Glomus cerebriforme]|uniref:Saposin B-type domain-containing protein n=1 Tax=Glomus cerebriforme TaxID=658196 RepID=A0A397SYD8_9GLOM|nr:hypothetical protein C1645_770970 [Glomus cerebriforme]
MKLFTVLASTLLFFLIIASKTNASCNDCQIIMENINNCNEVNIASCAPYYINPDPLTKPILLDCCEDQQLLFKLCYECSDPSTVSLANYFCEDSIKDCN